MFVDVQSNRKRHKEIRIIILIGGTVESPNNLKFEQFMAMFRSSLPIIVRQYPSNHTKLKFLHSFWILFWFSILKLPDVTNKKMLAFPFFYISEYFQPTFCLFGHFYEKEVFSQVVQLVQKAAWKRAHPHKISKAKIRTCSSKNTEAKKITNILPDTTPKWWCTKNLVNNYISRTSSNVTSG